MKKIFTAILFFYCINICTAEDPFSELSVKPLKIKEKGHVSLNGHKFIINSVMGSPFIETNLQTVLGAATTLDLKVPPIVIDSQEVVQLLGDLVYTDLELEYQQAIRDWMAFRIKVAMFGRSGTKAGTLISQGVNIVVGYELGWMFKLHQSKKFLLSGSLDITNSNYTVINLNDFIQEIIDSGRVTKSNKFVQNAPSVRAGGSLKGSYAFNKTFGVTGIGSLEYGEAVDDKEKDKWFLNYGLAFDADLNPGSSVPIGFLLGFYHNALPVSRQVLISEPNNVLFQINFTGRDDLNLGLESIYQFYKPEGFDKSIKFLSAGIHMRYFF